VTTDKAKKLSAAVRVYLAATRHPNPKDKRGHAIAANARRNMARALDAFDPMPGAHDYEAESPLNGFFDECQLIGTDGSRCRLSAGDPTHIDYWRDLSEAYQAHEEAGRG
jgi:hypothetical protein